MAKKSAKDSDDKKESKPKITSVFEGLDDLNPYGALLSESALSIVDSWTDTGSYALNAIISGSCYRGVQNGRVIVFCGPSGCGKTLLTMKIVGNHLREADDNFAVVFDSEIAVDAQTASNLGADPSRIRHYPVKTVNEARNQVLKLLNNIAELGLQKKCMVVIDSLGMLAGGKETADAEKDKDAADMGLRAKELRGLLRIITWPAAISKTTVLCTNHVYVSPSEMFPSAVNHQSGGEGPVYAASLIVQLGFLREKNEEDFKDEEMIAIAKKVGGITMHALTTKNRFIPQMLTTDLYLNFKTGLDKYSGLFEMAKAFNIIQGANKYSCGDVLLGFRKEFERDPDTWEKVLLPKLEAVVKKEFTFHSDADDLKKEADKLNESK